MLADFYSAGASCWGVPGVLLEEQRFLRGRGTPFSCKRTKHLPSADFWSGFEVVVNARFLVSEGNFLGAGEAPAFVFYTKWHHLFPVC